MGEVDAIPGTTWILHPHTHTHTQYSNNDNETITAGSLVLSPHPSASCNDPLNWSLSRKLWHTFLLLFITGLTSATTNSTWIAEEAMLEEYDIPFGDIDSGAGVLFIGIGLGTFLLSPVAWLYGRRLPYLICISLNILGMIWMSVEQNRQDSIWNQLFVGFSGSIAEANVQLSLSEIWFEHQRGSVLGMYVLITSVGTFLGPLISGFVVQNIGWRWIPHLSLIIFGITLVTFYFGFEETLFDRQLFQSISNLTGITTYSSASHGNFDSQDSPKMEDMKSDIYYLPQNTLPEVPYSYWKRIQLVTSAPNLTGYGFKQYMARLSNILNVFIFPAVFFSGIQWGAQDAWLSFYLKLQQDEWMEVPFNFTQSQSALLNIPTMIGAVMGCFWGGYLSDCFVLYIAKRRGGLSEAEDRLWMMMPCLIMSPAGLLIFGLGTAEVWHRYWSYMGLIFIGFGWGCAGDLSLSYLMDAYPDIVLEGMVGVSLINNVLGCIFSLLASYWFGMSGVRDCMIGVSCLSLFFVSLTIPMIVWGKDCRRYTFRKYQDFVKSRNAL